MATDMNNTDNRSFRDLFTSMSGNLDKLAGALEKNTKSVEDKIKEEFDNRRKALEQLKTENYINDKQYQRMKSEIEKQEQLAKEKELFETTHLEKQKAVGNQFVNALENAGKQVLNWAISQFTTNFNKIQGAYLDHFTSVTTRLNIAAKEYTAIFQDTARQFRQEGLDVQFDTTDFMNALETTLAQGLRGDMAQQKAMYDLIGKKLIPSINTANRDYVYTYRKWGETFAQNSIGLQNLTRMMGKNMEYYEQGMYSTTEEQFLRWFVNTGASQSSYFNMQNTLAQWTDYYGQETVNEFVSALNSSLQSGNVATQFALAGYATASDLWEALSDVTKQQELFRRYAATMGGMWNWSNGDITTLNILNQSGLTQSPMSIAAFNRYAQGVDTFDYGAYSASYALLKDELSSGLYSSETEKFNKMVANSEAIVNTSTTLAQVMPNQVQTLINTVLKGFTAVIGAIVMDRMGGSLFGSAGTGAIGAMKAGTASFTSGASGALGGAIGGVSLIGAGALWTIADAINSGIQTGSVSAGFKKAFTGSDFSGRDIEYQLAHSEVDWGEVLSTGGKGALIGAGAGSFAEGIGAIPGAIIGGIGGAFTNLMTQWMEKQNVQAYLREQNELIESTTRLVVSQANYSTALRKSTDVSTLLNTLNDEQNTTLEERNSAFNQLKAEYPTYLKYVKDASEWQEKYNEAIKSSYELELERARLRYQQSVAGSANAVHSMLTGMTVSGGMSEDIIDKIGAITDSDGNIDVTKFGRIASEYGMTPFELAVKYNEATGSNILINNNGDNVRFMGWQGNYKEIKDRYTTKRQSYMASDAYDKLLEQYDDYANIISGLGNIFEQETKDRIESGIEAGLHPTSKQFKEASRLFTSFLGDRYLISADNPESYYYDYFQAINDILAKKEVDPKYYYKGFASGTGIGMVGKNQLAYVHDHEMILNATNARKLLPLLAEVGIDTLSSNYGRASTETIPTRSIVNIDTTVLTISENVTIILSVLEEMRDHMVNQVSTPVRATNEYSTEDIRNYTSAIAKG